MGSSCRTTAAYPFADKAKSNLVEVRRVNTASTISQRDAYKLMLKDYPDVMSIDGVPAGRIVNGRITYEIAI